MLLCSTFFHGPERNKAVNVSDKIGLMMSHGQIGWGGWPKWDDPGSHPCLWAGSRSGTVEYQRDLWWEPGGKRQGSEVLANRSQLEHAAFNVASNKNSDLHLVMPPTHTALPAAEVRLGDLSTMLCCHWTLAAPHCAPCCHIDSCLASSGPGWLATWTLGLLWCDHGPSWRGQ